MSGDSPSMCDEPITKRAAEWGRELLVHGRNVARKALDAVPCHCPDAYYDRRLVAPDCDHHDLADEMTDFLTCDCVGCRRLR